MNFQQKDLRQSEEYAKYMQKRGWEVESIKYEANAFIRKIPLIGSVIKIQRPEVIPSEEELDKLAKKHRALFVKIEPAISNQLSAISYQTDNWPLLPSKTLRLNLTKPEEELWEQLDPDAKYSVRKASKSLCVMRYALRGFDKDSFSALKNFHQLLKGTGKSKGFYIPKWQDLKAKAECFGKKAWLILTYRRQLTDHGPQQEDGPSSVVSHQSPPLAGCLLLIHNGTAYYHHAASSAEGRRLLAGYPILWEAIRLAKKLGCYTFDFEGIYDQRFPKATRNWEGFTYFKKKFGGKEVEFPRPLIKYYSLPIRLLFKFFG